MNYDYGECSTCARRGDPYCVGCQPTMRSDGTYSRSLYTPREETIQVTTLPQEIGGVSIAVQNERLDEAARLIEGIVEELRGFGTVPPPRGVWIDIADRLDRAFADYRSAREEDANGS